MVTASDARFHFPTKMLLTLDDLSQASDWVAQALVLDPAPEEDLVAVDLRQVGLVGRPDPFAVGFLVDVLVHLASHRARQSLAVD